MSRAKFRVVDDVFVADICVDAVEEWAKKQNRLDWPRDRTYVSFRISERVFEEIDKLGALGNGSDGRKF